MDSTVSCPTCGHVEDASSGTCGFCGVELALDPDIQPVADPTQTSEQGASYPDPAQAELRAEAPIQNKPSGKPNSVDEAVAHVLSAAGEEEPLELIESVDMEAESAPAPPLQAEDGSAGQQEVKAGLPAEKAATDSKTKALQKHRAALAKAKALKKRKLALAKAAALKKKKMALKQKPVAAGNLRIQKLLKRYQGQTIGINYDNSAVIAPAELLTVNAEYISVLVQSKNLRYHFPLNTILSIIEGTDGQGVPTGAENEVYAAVIKIYPLVLF